jgi:hypothetical protein
LKDAAHTFLWALGLDLLAGLNDPSVKRLRLLLFEIELICVALLEDTFCLLEAVRPLLRVHEIAALLGPQFAITFVIFRSAGLPLDNLIKHCVKVVFIRLLKTRVSQTLLELVTGERVISKAWW